eukprot:409985_1
MSPFHQRFQPRRSLIRYDHLKDRSLCSRINWINCIVVFGVPAAAVYGICTIQTFIWKVWVWAVIYYVWTGLGITAGYHRLWSHKSYEASIAVQYFLMLGGSGALQGSIKWWSLLHRAHHRWTDTDFDPYNIQRGFFYAHVGWLLLDNTRVNKNVNIQDLKNNPIIRWQHVNFIWFGPFMAFIFP